MNFNKILIIFLILFKPVYSQIGYYTNKNEIRCQWEHAEGAFYYQLYIVSENADTIIATTTDSLIVISADSIPDGKYKMGIQSIDKAGNKSQINWAHECDNNLND